MSNMLVLKPGYAFVHFDKGSHKVIAHRPGPIDKRGKDEEYSYPAADSRIGRNQLHKFFPADNPDATASAHREANCTHSSFTPAAATEELEELAEAAEEVAGAETEVDEGEAEEDPLKGLEA